MKWFYLLFVFWCFSAVFGQRRATGARTETGDTTSAPQRRGRTRFAVVPQEETLAIPSRKTPPPNRRSNNTPQKNYEVQEVVDEADRKNAIKPRVLTENSFQAANAPSSQSLFQPSSTENLEEIISSPTTPELAAQEPESSSALPEVPRADKESTRKQPEATSPISARREAAGRRTNVRRNNPPGNQESTTTAPLVSRSRSRTRAPKKADQEKSSTAAPIPSRAVLRSRQRRPESTATEGTTATRTRGPSVLASPESRETPTRSRTGRRIPLAAPKKEEPKAPEKITLNLPTRSSTRGRSREATTEAVRSSRPRSRSRAPPVIDEQKLEVLPLFESDADTVESTRQRGEVVVASATENDIQIAVKPLHAITSQKESIVVETRTESTFKRRKPIKKNISKQETIISAITEVTSKRTINRKSAGKAGLPITSSRLLSKSGTRGKIKSEAPVKKHGSSEEEIDESDNYPAAFKALLNAKKQDKESRPRLHQPVTKSAPTSTSTTPSTTPAQVQQIEEFDNEVYVSSTTSVRPTRPRFSVRSTKAPERTRPTFASRKTTAASVVVPTREHRFHAKFHSEPEVTEKAEKSYAAKPRGLYSSRKNKDVVKSTKAASSQATPGASLVPKKAPRYSSRYRTDAAARSTIRTSTSAPAYLPTIPTILPPTTIKSPLEEKDLEVITFDDPVNTIPSANLVSGDYVASSTDSNRLTIPLVAEAQIKNTEKPVSIIESIINSITALSTEAPSPSKLTTPTQETHPKESAILKLATKKPTKLDKTLPTDTKTTQKTPNLTTEKPTTIIERILSSLSAIQAENKTVDNSFKAKQVGSNFNTISSASTTPLSRVPKSLPSLTSTTTLNPLIVLDEIANEQTLQKRTIGKLLALLNTLTSTTDAPNAHFIVVTPKKSFVASSTESIASTEPSTTLFTTPTTTPENTVSTSTLPTQETTILSTTQDSSTLSGSTTVDFARDIDVLSLFVAPSVTSLVTESTTPSTVSTTDLSASIGTTTISTEGTFDTESVFTFPSTLPALSNFEVSPDSVSIFSANDLLSNAVTLDDIGSTVTISSRFNDFVTTTESTTPSATITTVTESSDVGTTLTESGSTTLAAITTTSVNTSNATDVSSNLIDSNATESSISNVTSTTSSSTNISNRSGRLLNVIEDSLESNSIENSTAVSDPDYFIFAVLNNNTILRKRPDRFPNKNTPFLIVGVYPNSTIVRKFPNGTLVPMEPVVRVEQNTIPNVEVNPVFIDTNTTSSSSTESSTESSTVSTTSAEISTLPVVTTPAIASTTTVTLPTLTEILNGKTVQAFNKIINISDLTKQANDDSKSNTEAATTPPATTPELSNRILENPTTPLPTTTTGVPTTTLPPSTTQIQTTLPPTTTTNTPPTTTAPVGTTRKVVPTTNSPSFRTTTFLPTTTVFPVFLQNLLSNIQTTTFAPPTTTATNRGTSKFNFDLVSVGTSTRPVTTTLTPVTTTFRRARTTTFAPETSTLPISTTTRRSRSRSTLPPETTTITTTLPPITTHAAPSKRRVLTEQQKLDLEAITRLENEQKAILKQLSFLANLNLNNNANKKVETTTTQTNDLASRVIALAVERDKNRPTTTLPPSTRNPKSIDPAQPIDEIVKQLNLATPTIGSPFGTSNEALIAQLLKEQGINPSTPKSLVGIYSKTTTTRRPRPTTRPPGPLMNSLNWLLNALAPPTTKRPRAKPKPRKLADQEELLTHQPTHITPVVTAAPATRNNIASALSQDDIRKLINQLETIQKNPKGEKKLDLTSIKSLQTLISSDEQVKVTTAGVSGSTARGRVAKSTTSVPVSVSNSIDDDEEELDVLSTSVKPRPSLPPLRLKPVAGIEEGEPMIRGQLITAAVNVTRAISSFLGTALQAAASRLSRVFSGGSGSLASTSSLYSS